MVISKDLRQEIVRAENDPHHLLFSGDVLITEDYLLYSRLGGDYAKYDELELDPHVSAIIQKRKMAVISREWDLMPSDSEDDNAIALTKAVKKIIEFCNPDRLSFDALNALMMGFSATEYIWQYKKISDKERLIVQECRGKSPNRFAFVRENNENPPPTVAQHQGFALHHLSQGNSFKGDPLPINKFLIHSHGSKIGSPYGLGLGSKLWWMTRFKKEITKSWIIFCDRFAQPTPYGQYPTEGSHEELDQFLASISQGSWASLPDGYKINLLEAQRSGSVSTYEGFQKWADGQMSQAVLGETGTTDQSGDGGSRARDEVGNEVRLEIAKGDADLLSAAINEYLIKPIVKLNWGDDVEPPAFYRHFDEQENLDSRASRDNILFQMGFRLTLDKVTEIYGEGYEDTQAAADETSIESVLGGMEPGADGAGNTVSQEAGLPANQENGQNPAQDPVQDPVQDAEQDEQAAEVSEQAIASQDNPQTAPAFTEFAETEVWKQDPTAEWATRGAADLTSTFSKRLDQIRGLFGKVSGESDADKFKAFQQGLVDLQSEPQHDRALESAILASRLAGEWDVASDFDDEDRAAISSLANAPDGSGGSSGLPEPVFSEPENWLPVESDWQWLKAYPDACLELVQLCELATAVETLKALDFIQAEQVAEQVLNDVRDRYELVFAEGVLQDLERVLV